MVYLARGDQRETHFTVRKMSAGCVRSSSSPLLFLSPASSPSKWCSSTPKAEQDVLKQLLAHMKSSISRLNKGEGSSKKLSLNMTERLGHRLELDRLRAKDPNLSAADREL